MATRMRLPDFIGIGTPRCGTTYLSHLLNQHSDIYFAPYYKEIHYFDNNYHRGLKWYSTFYNNTTNHKSCGDFTPSYMFQEKVISLIKEFNPRVKLIVCVRDPVNRAFSHYMQRNRYQNGKNNFDETIRHNHQDILGYGQYGYQLNQVLKHFSKDQIKIIVFEELIEKPQKILSELFEFLNLNNFIINSNETPKNYMKEFHFKIIQHTIRGIRSMGRRYYYFRILLYYLFPGHRLIQKLKKINMKKVVKNREKMSLETQQYLIEYYTEDKKLLEKILGKSISNWQIN